MDNRCDSFGSPTSADACTLGGINAFAEGFIAYEPRASEVLATADEHEGCALANLYAGCLWLFLERPEAPARAAPYLARADAVRTQHPRERALGKLLRAWQRYDFEAVVAIADQMLETWPQDLVTLKLAQYHLFNAGNSAGMLRLALKVEQFNGSHAAFYSMLAFANEQCHQMDAAQRAAERALTINAREPWAHHALAHIHLVRGQVDEGRRFMQQMSPTWRDLNSFMFTHNWWHLALFEIAAGQPEAALGIYDERCWGVQRDYSQDQVGAISLLARLECAGVDVGERWQSMAEWLESRADDVIQPFMTLQYLYGLARCRPARARELMARILDQSRDPVVAGDRKLWEQVGIPAARGVLAHAERRYVEATTHLACVQSRLWQVGGSHAQRDLFDQLLLDSLLASGQWAAARHRLELRRQVEPDNPLLHQRLAEVHRELGLPDSSASGPLH